MEQGAPCRRHPSFTIWPRKRLHEHHLIIKRTPLHEITRKLTTQRLMHNENHCTKLKITIQNIELLHKNNDSTLRALQRRRPGDRSAMPSSPRRFRLRSRNTKFARSGQLSKSCKQNYYTNMTTRKSRGNSLRKKS